MKRTTLLSGAILACLCTQAQIARWAIPPEYDAIYVNAGSKMLATDSAGVKTLWSMDGKALYRTDELITPFCDSIATVVTRHGGLIIGKIDTDGRFTPLPDLRSAYGSYSFNDGYLLYRDDSGYGYLTPDGEEAPIAKATVAYPFYGGMAAFWNYSKPDRRKGQYFGYVRANGKPMHYYPSNGTSTNAINQNDIRFLSSIGSDGKGYAVVKKKLYIFDTSTNFFAPMTHADASGDEKHLCLDGNHDAEFANLPADSTVIHAKYGDNEPATLYFDNELRPVRFEFSEGETQTFDEEPESEAPVKYDTHLVRTGKTGAYGISLDSVEVVAPLLQDVGLLYGNHAFARKDGKWGLLELVPDKTVSIKFNDGKDLAFTHRTACAEMRVTLPNGLKESKLDISADESGTLTIDRESRKLHKSEDGSYLCYTCTATMPDSVCDSLITLRLPPVTVLYDGIALQTVAIEAKGTYKPNYSVEPFGEAPSVANDTATAIFSIVAPREATDDTYYRYSVECVADSLPVSTDQLADNIYRLNVANLKAGENTVTLRVTEKGCPTVEFPYIISYASNDGLEAVSIYKDGEQPQPAAIETATAPAQGTPGSAPAPPSKDTKEVAKL